MYMKMRKEKIMSN